MIIWIDGTYGVGKTKVAERLYEKLKDNKLELVNSDFYYIDIIPKIAIYGGGTTPQDNELFLSKFKKIIEQKLKEEKKTVIIDMAITKEKCKKILFDDFKDKYNNIFHFILNASNDNLRKRINNDKKRDKSFAQEHMKENICFLRNNFEDDIWIDTDNKSVDEVVEEIIRYIIKKKKDIYC